MRVIVFLLAVLIILLLLCRMIPEVKFSDLTQLLPSFEGEHGDIKRFAFIMVVMIFILGLVRIIFRRQEDD